MSQQDENNSIFKIGINLTVACLLSGAIIAGVFIITEPVAIKERANMKTQALKELVAEADTFKEIDGKTDWYTAIKDSKTIAYIVSIESKGYGGAIKMLTAVTSEGKTIGYKILAHNETPGLGDKATGDKFSKQFAGKSLEDLEVVKVTTDKNIQALTGATITSKAVTKGVKEAVEAVVEYAASHKE